MSKEEKNICDACHQEILWKETAVLNVSLDIIYQTGTDPEKPLGCGKVHMEGDFHYACFWHEIQRQVALTSHCIGTFLQHPIRDSWTIPVVRTTPKQTKSGRAGEKRKKERKGESDERKRALQEV